MNIPEITKKLQKVINLIRKKYGDKSVVVSHSYSETTISINLSLVDDPWAIGDEIDKVYSEYDSGSGLGFRDLSLCRLFPDLI